MARMSSSWQAIVRWAMAIAFLVWLTLGDVVLCLFAALRHSAAYDPYTGALFGPAFAFWFVAMHKREKRDGLAVPLFFLGFVVLFLATLPVVRPCLFKPGTHEIAIRGPELLIPMLLAKAVCWEYVLRLPKLRSRPPS